MTNAEDRLARALAAPAAPAKDMHFTLEVMRRAEAGRFRAQAARGALRGAGLAALAAAAILGLADQAAARPDVLLDGALALAAVAAVAALFRNGRGLITVRGR